MEESLISTLIKKTFMKKYKIVNDTSYHQTTPDNLISILENCRKNRIRIVIDYGDTSTKESWKEEKYITGYVGRSTGSIKIPLLVYNSRSLGGDSLLDNCILSIKTSKSKKTLYQL